MSGIQEVDKKQRITSCSRNQGKCNMCGMCCKAIVLSYTVESMNDLFLRHFEGIPKSEINDLKGDLSFIYKHWTNISKEEALRINPYLVNWKVPKQSYWVCDAFDKKTNKCTLHEHKTHVCNGYPYYGDNKLDKNFVFYCKECGFNTPVKEGFHV